MTEQTDSAQPKSELRQLLNELATHRRRPALCMISEMDDDLCSVAQNLSGVFEMVNGNELSVLLKSPGGDIEAAYRTALSLREEFEHIEVLVPYEAKSAATFFCLAADSILMGRYGELGPLDPQMLDRTGSERLISALESSKSMEELLAYSLRSLDGVFQWMLTRTDMDVPDAIEHAQPLFAAIVSPLYAQVDPHELGESARSLAIGEEYTIRVMERWGYSELSDIERLRIARRLVRRYPTHGFVIDLTEAEEIGLNVERMDAESDSICRHIIDSAYTDLGFVGLELGIPVSRESTEPCPDEVSCPEGLSDA